MATNSELNKVMNGEIKLHEIHGENANETRRSFLEKKLGVKLDSLKTGLTESICKNNIENLFGAIQMPLGIAGPVDIKGDFTKGSFFVPLATTEGALVASVNRGIKAINESGGCETFILKNEQTRSILFKAKKLSDVKKLLKYLDENYEKLKKAGEENERFLEIKKIEPFIVGLNVWLRIHAYTNDAMGMNMVTIAGKKIGSFIEKNFHDAIFISESGNMCTDKKPSCMNMINSRGKKVIASVEINEETIKKILKTKSADLIDMNYRKNLLGSAASGSLGFNAHFANIIAALFIATGQDAAHVVDGSIGFTTVEKTSKGINFSVTLNDLQVGTVGGGTVLPGQKACLEILGCAGTGKVPGENSKKLAEIAACAVLAGEISLLAALCTKDLSNAHIMHNR